MLTLTLTGLGADSWLAGGSNPRWGRPLTAVAATLGGAIGGAMLVISVGLVGR